jgi:protein-S-isoprenylcysteine O-methyltransferase Ste14
MSFGLRLAIRTLFAPLSGAALLLLPAGSLSYWQGVSFITLFTLFTVITTAYLYVHDAELLQRRMSLRERQPQQTLFKVLWLPLWIADFFIAGFDYRFGWSGKYLAAVPLWLTVIAQLLNVCAYAIIFEVFRFNTFAASTIRVEEGQRVISTGPYRMVRHPMYSGISLLILSAPLALGSFVAAPFFLPLILLLAYRLTHEEALLRRDLAGYDAYCLRTPFRLVPHVY